MSYFCVGTKDDSLKFYAWADNAQHAVRTVEAHYDMALPPQRVVATPIAAEEIPEGDDVIGEPETWPSQRSKISPRSRWSTTPM
jgi:hypothetical protein